MFFTLLTVSLLSDIQTEVAAKCIRRHFLEELRAINSHALPKKSESAGWMLRYVGKADNPALMSFCDTHLEYFTPEGLRYALEKQPNAALKQYTARLKDLKSDSKKDAQEQAQKPAKKVKKSPNISVQKDSERVRTRTRSGRVERSTTSKSQVVGGAQGGQMKRASSCDNSKNGLDNNDSTGNGNAVKHRRMRRRKT